MRTEIVDENHAGLGISLSCRKRPRSPEDDCEDCLPISKRINSLHIQGVNGNTSKNSEFCQRQPVGIPHGLPPSVGTENGWYQPGNICNTVMSSQYSSSNGPSSSASIAAPNQDISTQCDTDELNKYDPELDRSSNPHYYDINQILYEAHIARSLRAKAAHRNS